MEIMQVGLSTLYDIGSSYTIPLNDEEILIVEEDKERKDAISSQTQSEKEEKTSKEKLSPDEERLVRDLQSRDSEVRAHEAAHQAAGGGMTGAASYTYQQGPDGKMYAIGGEVSITMKSDSTPEETIANARQIAAAAMAAGNPSPQDYAVASSARVMEMKAQQQLAREQQEELLVHETYAIESNAYKANKQGDTAPLEPLDISA